METQSQESKITSQTPEFHHQEIEWLYSHGLRISEEKLNTILSLPRETLIQDLEAVMQDSINRYDYFKNLAEETEWAEEQMNIVVHSLFLLAELKSTESLVAIFNVFSQSQEYLELYLGDFLTDSMWEVLYKVAAHDVEACKQFMLKPDLYLYSRGLVFEVLTQIALHDPSRRAEVISWYTDVIQIFLNNSVNDYENIGEVIGGLICEVIKMEGKELLPEIEKLFERGMVAAWVCGDWESVSEAFGEPSSPYSKRKIFPVVERYKNVISTWHFYTDGKNVKSNMVDNFGPVVAPVAKPVPSAVRTEAKVGRNEPCPCGSGKKYKKCCLNK